MFIDNGPSNTAQVPSGATCFELHARPRCCLSRCKVCGLIRDQKNIIMPTKPFFT